MEISANHQTSAVSVHMNWRTSNDAFYGIWISTDISEDAIQEAIQDEFSEYGYQVIDFGTYGSGTTTGEYPTMSQRYCFQIELKKNEKFAEDEENEIEERVEEILENIDWDEVKIKELEEGEEKVSKENIGKILDNYCELEVAKRGSEDYEFNFYETQDMLHSTLHEDEILGINIGHIPSGVYDETFVCHFDGKVYDCDGEGRIVGGAYASDWSVRELPWEAVEVQINAMFDEDEKKLSAEKLIEKYETLAKEFADLGCEAISEEISELL